MGIRGASREDATDVQRVARAAWHAAHDPVLGLDAVDDLLDRWYSLEDLSNSIESEEAPMFVAADRDDDEGTVVGFAQGGPSDEDYADAVVGRIYVHPDCWGEGHGSALLERLFDAFRADGHESVWLAVLADNEVGRSFYDDHGFALQEERSVELAGVQTTDVVLVRDL